MYRTYFVFLSIFWVFLSSVEASHETTPSFVRRSVAHKKRLELQARRLEARQGFSLDPGATVSSVSQGPDGNVQGTVNGQSTTFPVDSSTPVDTPSSSTKDCGLLGLGCSGGDSSSTAPPQASTPPPDTNTAPPAQSTPPAETSSEDCGLLGLGCSGGTSSPSFGLGTTTTPAPSGTNGAGSPPPQSSSEDCGLLGLGCVGGTSSPSFGLGTTSTPPPASTPNGGGSNTTPPPAQSTSQDCGLLGLGCVGGTSSPSFGLGTTSNPPQSTPENGGGGAPPQSSSTDCGLLGLGCAGGTSSPSFTLGTGSPTSTPNGGSPPQSTSSDCGLLGLGCVGGTSSPSLSLGPTSTPVIISFPSTPIISVPSSVPSLPLSSGTPTTTTSRSSFSQSQPAWLTQTSLVFETSSSSTVDPSITNPDQASTSIPVTAGGTAIPSSAPLPSGLPARILPGEGGVNPSTADLTGYSMISILFDLGLSWQFVVQNGQSPTQIFTWFPVLIESSLGITADQIKTFALQVWIPETYKGPQDVAQLGTLWLGYIPTDLVDTLASDVKARQSLFYTANSDPYYSLAQHVNPSFDIDTVTNPGDGPGTGGGSSSDNSGSGGDNSQAREDAIIGVVSALGGITLLVLGFLVWRATQRRKELAHRRLSDPQDGYSGVPPADRDFDQDSVGGQRRRSFYFAEDSLRTYSDAPRGADHSLNRRAVAPSTISAPVMRENSLNF